MIKPMQSLGSPSSVPSTVSDSGLVAVSSGRSWNTEDFIRAHVLIKDSGKHNFEGCKLPLPTAIRYDRLEEVLGDNTSPKECRMLSLLRYGMPIGCNPSYGAGRIQKSHFSVFTVGWWRI